MPMRTKEEMYNFAAQNNLVGIPMIAYPLKWFGKMDFGVIEQNLLDNELAVFTFMAIANPNDFDNRGTNGMNNNNNQPQNTNNNNAITRKWVAFALTNKGNLYYGHWKLFASDSGNVPIRSEQDLNLNINQHFAPYHSALDIDTLRKSLPNLNQTYANLKKIRNNIYNTVQSFGSHVDSEDGRRVYDQAISNYDEDQQREDEL